VEFYQKKPKLELLLEGLDASQTLGMWESVLDLKLDISKPLQTQIHQSQIQKDKVFLSMGRQILNNLRIRQLMELFLKPSLRKKKTKVETKIAFKTQNQQIAQKHLTSKRISHFLA
jgi:hypothetical protein